MCFPLVSVIMPCRNSGDTVGKAVSSVLSQDYENLELIVIDDGSTDSTPQIVENLAREEPRVILIVNTGVHGVAHARNLGLARATGRFVSFLDSDDYLLPGSIVSRVITALNFSAKVVYGPYLRQYENGDLFGVAVPRTLTYSKMLKRNYIGNLTGMYDSEWFGKVYQVDVRHEDYFMWCSLLKDCGVAYSTGASPLAVYRVSNNSLSSNKIKSFFWHWSVLRSGLKIGFFRSIYFQIHYGAASILARIFRKRDGFL